jgi:hypothetical protein
MSKDKGYTKNKNKRAGKDKAQSKKSFFGSDKERNRQKGYLSNIAVKAATKRNKFEQLQRLDNEFITQRRDLKKPNKKSKFSYIQRRWVKHLYTAALRFGQVINEDKSSISYFVNAKFIEAINGRPYYHLYKGDLTIEDELHSNVFIVIDKRGSRHEVVTFYPVDYDKDAKLSTTDPLVNLYLEDAANVTTPGYEYSIEVVANYYHTAYKKNPGINPSRVMNTLYAGLSESNKQRIDDLDRELMLERIENDECKDNLNRCKSELKKK